MKNKFKGNDRNPVAAIGGINRDNVRLATETAVVEM